ncbi:MAG: DUF1232 domain-containing protein [Opitutaceae bacterium]|nr:DUF1232 domain-containing protein [Opitutaceae bacterium]
MLLVSSSPSHRRIASLPEVLNRHLAAGADSDRSSVATYIDRGAALVDAAALHALHRLRRPLQLKIEQLEDSAHLRRRLELLSTYFDEASADGSLGAPAHREVAFALLYFLNGMDRIPDALPEIGLLDDAMVVQIVLQRHAATFRAHWLRRRRSWPSEL